MNSPPRFKRLDRRWWPYLPAAIRMLAEELDTLIRYEMAAAG